MSEPESLFARLRQAWNQAPPTLRQRWPWFIAGGVLLGFLLVVAIRWASPSNGNDSAEGGEKPTATNVGANAGSAREDGGAPGLAPVQPPLKPSATVVDAGAPLSPNVKLTFRTFPPRRATVTWGGKRLGIIERNRPLVVERARDSGPLDVVVRSPGYLTVHARAYTFNDAVVDVKITPLDKKDTLYGYQQPLGDAGVPEIAAP
jgi:hypothetical protein